ncbi:MAG: DUF92 domain-containing protein [Candidatus Diapherotrites archaeon]
MIEWLLLAVFLAGFALLANYKKVLDTKGIAAALALGVLSFILGMRSEVGAWPALGVIVLFFVPGEIVTRWARTLKGPKHEVRGVENIVGNAGVALIALLFQQPIGFFAAMSCALSDTFSSEIGMLSKKQPWDILSWKKVKRGVNGAISLLGEGAALLGAGIMALAYWVFFSSMTGAVMVLFFGFFGQLVDSWLGAKWEEKRKLNNTHVNFLSTAAAAVLAVLIAMALHI